MPRPVSVLVPLLILACDDVDGFETPPLTTDCTGADTFVAGMEEATTLGNTVRLMAATPSPPDVGDNAWEIEVVDGEGNPIAGLTPTVRPWMPLHGHGVVPATYAGTEGNPGYYTIDTFDVIMPGLWEFTVDLQGDESDTALFALCAEG